VQLVSHLHMRLQQEGLEFRDLPSPDDREFLQLLAELGFESALERAKLKRAVRDLLSLGCPSDAKRSCATLSTAASTEDELASEVSSEFVPALGAYYTGERVEYFSRHVRQWLPAEVVAEPRATGQRVVYSATPLPDGREHYDVGLCALRPPLREGEPCEVLQGQRWLEAVASSGQQGEGPGIRYRVALLGEEPAEALVPASRLRRRFPPGSLVSAYQGPGLGWADAMVVSSCGREGAGGSPRALQGPGHGEEWAAEVLICMEAGGTIEQLLRVPSYLLRFRPEYLHQYVLWSSVRAEAACVGCADSRSVLTRQESFAMTASVLELVA